MSDSHDEHASGIKTPKQLIAAVVAGFIVPIIGIVLLVQYVASENKVGVGSDAQTPAAISARLQPVADAGFTFKDVTAAKVLQSGQAVYNAVCMACHAAGVAGAPKVGDAAAWSARIAQGYDTLVSHAINGIRGMPARGGNPDLDDVEVGRAVVFMANQAGAKFKEPEVKATVTAAAPAASESAAAAPAPAMSAAASSAGASVASPAAATPAAASTPTTVADKGSVAADAGKKLYGAVCVNCHGAGIAGSPKFGDKLAWADRIKQGQPTLYEHAIKGYQGKAGVMPAKGGSAASDDEVKAAVDYMTAAAK
ncbi:MAG: c-type cytochrome [Pseudomonadota bacterium]|nr:c-type cytochrome [Pseudomonadota bacterium]